MVCFKIKKHWFLLAPVQLGQKSRTHSDWSTTERKFMSVHFSTCEFSIDVSLINRDAPAVVCLFVLYITGWKRRSSVWKKFTPTRISANPLKGKFERSNHCSLNYSVSEYVCFTSYRHSFPWGKDKILLWSYSQPTGSFADCCLFVAAVYCHQDAALGYACFSCCWCLLAVEKKEVITNKLLKSNREFKNSQICTSPQTFIFFVYCLVFEISLSILYKLAALIKSCLGHSIV